MTRFLSGVQPSGRPHLGNYLGAIQQHVALQKDGTAYYFIADYHALTTVQNAETLREHVRDLAPRFGRVGRAPCAERDSNAQLPLSKGDWQMSHSNRWPHPSGRCAACARPKSFLRDQ